MHQPTIVSLYSVFTLVLIIKQEKVQSWGGGSLPVYFQLQRPAIACK